MPPAHRSDDGVFSCRRRTRAHIHAAPTESIDGLMDVPSAQMLAGVNYLVRRRIDSSELLPELTCCLT